MSQDLVNSLEEIIDAGMDRVLTSGGKQNAEDGIQALFQLFQVANQRIAVMAGGGITESNVPRVMAETGVREIHASVRAHVPSPMKYRIEKINMGLMKGREYQRFVVTEDRVRRLLDAMNGNRNRMKATRNNPC